jgi:hypothetical protein
MENKKHLWKRQHDDQEWHLALGMSTLETAHAGRVRENTPAKQHQVKAWATKAQ